jgi:hypothetical protein
MTLEICPTCGQPRRAQKGEGASYALNWHRLKPQTFGLLEYLYARFKDQQSFDELQVVIEFKIKGSGFAGRVSELRAWNLIVENKIKGKPISYRLTPRAKQVLDAGGDLTKLPRLKPGFDDQAITYDIPPGPTEGFTGYRKQLLGEGNNV